VNTCSPWKINDGKFINEKGAGAKPLSRRCHEYLLIARTSPPAATLVLLNLLHGYADGDKLYSDKCAAVHEILQIKHSAQAPQPPRRHRTGSRG
jgi:hypothetical protein